MGNLDDITQKIKGKAQQAKGDIEDMSGNEGQALWDRTKGKANETIADFKLDNKDEDDGL